MPTNEEQEVTRERGDGQPTAQDVVDALRLAFMAQSDTTRKAKLAEALIEMAPETDSNRGVQLLIDLIAEGSLVVEMAQEPSR